jgi:serine/threonine protein kinase HipA of HipAB toxin-antitoxin module
MAETSLRRIRQKRFDKLWTQVIDIPALPLQGELAAAGPLPLQQLVARKDGWVVAGWRRRDAGSRIIEGSFDTVPGETIIHQEILPGTTVPAEILSGGTTPSDLRLAARQ